MKNTEMITGNTLSLDVYKYDDKGLLIEVDKYDKSGSINEKNK